MKAGFKEALAKTMCIWWRRVREWKAESLTTRACPMCLWDSGGGRCCPDCREAGVHDICQTDARYYWYTTPRNAWVTYCHLTALWRKHGFGELPEGAKSPESEDTMSNERKQNMPPHCGNCIHHEWDGDRSTCMHPCKVSRDGLRQEVQDLAADGGMSAIGIAESLMDDAISDQEWQPYDAVCDNWRGRECISYPERGQEERRVRAEAEEAFCQLVESMMHQRQS